MERQAEEERGGEAGSETAPEASFRRKTDRARSASLAPLNASRTHSDAWRVKASMRLK